MSRTDREAEERRKAARAGWPITRVRLGDETAPDLAESTTAAERIAMMRELSETAWRIAGRPLPTYDRSTIPARLFRAGTRPDGDDA
jgi:hypothetical protein